MARFFNRRRASDDTLVVSHNPADNPSMELSKEQIKRATRTRKTWALITSFFLFVAVVFLILVEIAGIKNKKIINNWYFIRFDFSNVVPSSVPNSALINTIAQTLGLHDFYQVGLWGFCEGYKNEGVTNCSKPQALYWFNPVEILRNQLLAGASINLPSNINDILGLIRFASNWMFGLFLTGTCLSFVLIFLMPMSVYTRWLTLPVAIFAFLNALVTTVGAIIATVMFIIFRNTITAVKELNIGANIGISVFAFMWVASAFTIFAWLVQMGMCCCCASRRDVKTGRKRGSKKAYSGVPTGASAAATATEPKTAPNAPTAPTEEKKKRFWQRRQEV